MEESQEVKPSHSEAPSAVLARHPAPAAAAGAGSPAGGWLPGCLTAPIKSLLAATLLIMLPLMSLERRRLNTPVSADPIGRHVLPPT